MKKMIMVIALAVAMLAGCATLRPNNRPAEMRQEQYVRAGYRSGAEILLVNERTCTNVDWYLYNGQRSKEELLLNVDGKNVVSGGYIDSGWLRNAYNFQNPTMTRRLVDITGCKTVLRVVHWGIAGDYSVDAYSFCPTTSATQGRYQDGFGRVYYANQVILMPGSDTPAIGRLDLSLTVHPGSAVKGFLNGLFGR